MNKNANVKELVNIIKLARKYSLIGEYGNSLEKYQEAIGIIKQRQEELINDSEDIKEKWKMTEYNIKSEMIQIKDILQTCLQLHHSDFSYNKKQNEGFYFLSENKKIIEKEINETFNKDKKGNEKNIKNTNSYTNLNRNTKTKIKSKSSNTNNNYPTAEIKKNKINKINPFQGNKNNYSYKNNANIKKSKSLKEPAEKQMFNPLEEFYGHKLNEKDIININKVENINGINKEKIVNKNEKQKKIKIVSIDLDKDYLIQNNKIINENKEGNDNMKDISNISNKNVDMVEQALANFSKFNLDNTDDSI